MEAYLLRLALRRDFGRLKTELIGNHSYEEQRRLLSRLPDIEIAIFTVQAIIEKDDGYERYGLAARVLTAVRDRIAGIDNQLDAGLEQVCFYAKMLNLLSQVGRQAAQGVVSLMRDYFPTCSYDKDFAKDVSQAYYSELRSYILEVLLRGERSEHFAKRKFPTDSVLLRPKLLKVYSKLQKRWAAGFGHLQLSLPLSQLSPQDQNDPAICLYYEKCADGEGGAPRETDLIEFVRRIRDTQLSVKMPEALILPTPNFQDSEGSGFSLTGYVSSATADSDSPKERRRRDSQSQSFTVQRPLRSIKRRQLSSSGVLDKAHSPKHQSNSLNTTFPIRGGLDNDYLGPDMFSDDAVQNLVASDDLFIGPRSKRRRAASHRRVSEVGAVDLEAQGVTKVYDLQGNLLSEISGKTYSCTVQIEPIDYKKLRRSNVRVVNFEESGRSEIVTMVNIM